MEYPNKPKRIEYIDAMRGFTMILVVYSHIHQFSIHAEGLSFNHLLILIRMPLFFFLSGFLVEKVGQIWDIKTTKDFLLKKFKVQIIPTIVFLSLYCFIFEKNLISGILDPSKYGYWFTIALFEFFIFYSIVKFCTKKYQTFLLIILSLILLIINMKLNLGTFFNNILSGYFSWYFVFFAFGVIVKKHFTRFLSFIDSNWMVIIIPLFFISALLRIKGVFFINIPFQLPYFGILGICIVFSFFRRYQSSFTKDTVLGRSLQYIGTRTLDIYLLHYLFLPQNLNVIGKFFTNNYNPSVEFFVSILLSLLVISLCLITSNIIRINPILGHYLFGVKKQ